MDCTTATQLPAGDTIAIDLGDGRTVPLSPPAELGVAFSAVIAQASTWDTMYRDEVGRRYAAVGNDDDFDEASDRVAETLTEYDDLGWSCRFGTGSGDEHVEAGPYIDTLYEVSGAAAEIATAVLARDLGLVTEADFQTLTAWWETCECMTGTCRGGTRSPPRTAESRSMISPDSRGFTAAPGGGQRSR
jgi:hypothetical protein